MQEIVLKIRLFERGLLKKIKNVNFIFPFKPNLYPNIHLLYIYIYIYYIYNMYSFIHSVNKQWP